MQYQISIDYTSNVNKAGKLTLIDENNNIILSKIPVAIPVVQINSPGRTELNLTAEQIVKHPSLIALDSSRASVLNERIDRLLNKGHKKLIMSNPSSPLFVSQDQNTENLQIDKNSFVINKSDFKVLFNILEDKDNSVTLKASKVSFLWFPEKVNAIPTDIVRDYQSFKNKEQTLIMELQTEQRTKAAKESERRSTVVPTVQAKQKNNDIQKFNSINLVKQVKPLTPTQKVNIKTNNQINDDIDPFDVMFMYSHPELAPMYKPNSMLAWYMYFNDNDREINKTTIQDNVRDIPGFENVASTDVRYTPSGYSVTLYEDEQKTKPLGVINHNDNDKCYDITSPSGEKTTLQVDRQGVINGCVIGSDNKSTNFNFIENGSGFSGNWNSSPSEGITVTSGMSLDSNYEVTSSLNKSIDLSTIAKSRDDELSKSYEADNSLEWKAPPPPPPPPSDTMQWSSTSDPYSNTSSFSM